MNLRPKLTSLAYRNLAHDSCRGRGARGKAASPTDPIHGTVVAVLDRMRLLRLSRGFEIGVS